MLYDNPAGTNGFDFLEFTTLHPATLIKQFESMGFTKIADHQQDKIMIYQQNDTRFILNFTQNSHANEFAKTHGPSVSAMGFRVKNADFAYQHALNAGATSYSANNETPYHIPAIQGVGGSLIYFIDHKENLPNYTKYFSFSPHHHAPSGTGLTYIDHVTHNLYRGNMDKWANFYSKLFNFREVRYFDIEGKMTGLKSRALTSPCGKIRIPLNESSDDHSQIEEFLKAFNGEGIQHIALGTDDIYKSVDQLQKNGLLFLDTPDTYYDLIESRLPKHGEPLNQLKKQRILIDGNAENGKKILLQIFTQNMLGPVFFEVIQRKGDEGFGEGNFQALFESIELDQIKRGVLQAE